MRCSGRTTSATTRARPRRCSSSSGAWRTRRGRARPRPRLLHRLRRGPARPARRGQDDPGGGRGRRVRRAAAPGRALRVRDRRRGHEDDLLHARPGPGAPSRSTCSRRAAAAPAPSSRRPRASSRCASEQLAQPALRGHEPPQGQQQVRHLRRDRRQHAREDRACRSRRSSRASSRRSSTRTSPRSPRATRPAPEVLLLGGPNLFFKGLQEAWRHHLGKLWAQRKVALPEGRDPASLITVPAEALYYACLGCVEIGAGEAAGVARLPGPRPAALVDRGGPAGGEGQGGRRARWWPAPRISTPFVAEFDRQRSRVGARRGASWPARCSSAATSAAPPPRRSCSRPTRELLFTCYALSKGNPDRGRPGAVPPGARGGLHARSAGSRSPATARTS